MENSFIAFAGRPWDVADATHPSRFVGEFATFDDALDAYPSVRFVEMPTRSGCRRWRGQGPRPGLIVQLEQAHADVHELSKIA
ncbi:hypothetical protein [Enemella sp. A6]|uniref:hypothetical protein n=1 Tax=Enemella sp. A6 TaxID=3440152 RepID=UPI003EBA4BA7